MDQPEIEFHSIFKKAAVAATFSLVLFIPTLGIVLEKYDFITRFSRAFWAALAVFVGQILVGIYRRKNRLKAMASPISKSTTTGLSVKVSKTKFVLFVVLGFAIFATIPFYADKYWLGILNLTLIYVLLGLGLNIVVGLAGLLDLGFVAFYAVGAYGYALLNQNFDLGFWPSLILASSVAAFFGAVLGFPVLRLHGDYLAIVTLGFGEIINLVLTNWSELTGGPNGLRAPPPTFFGLEFSRFAKQGGVPFHEFFGLEYQSETLYQFIYISLILVVGMVIFAVTRLKNMPIGRAWEALRENEIACKALGINHVFVKLSAFSMGAFIGGIAGVFFAGFQGFIDPLSFTFVESAQVLAIVVLGGMGSTSGVILAAFALTLIPEFLREFSEYRIMIFGSLMVLMMIWRPRGLIRSSRKNFDLAQALRN